MPTSAGKIRNQQRVGMLEFTLKGQALTLAAYVEEGADLSRLFVPFTDMTSGTETYAAGRYLELDRTADRDRVEARLAQLGDDGALLAGREGGDDGRTGHGAGS